MEGFVSTASAKGTIESTVRGLVPRKRHIARIIGQDGEDHRVKDEDGHQMDDAMVLGKVIRTTIKVGMHEK